MDGLANVAAPGPVISHIKDTYYPGHSYKEKLLLNLSLVETNFVGPEMQTKQISHKHNTSILIMPLWTLILLVGVTEQLLYKTHLGLKKNKKYLFQRLHQAVSYT